MFNYKYEDLLENLKFKGKKIGFKMEVDSKNALENAKKSLLEKKLDMVCLNVLDKENYFGSDKNKLCFITANELLNSALKSKEELAFELARLCQKL